MKKNLMVRTAILLALAMTVSVLGQEKTLQWRKLSPAFYDPQNGLSAKDLIKRGLEANEELAAARFDVEKSQARLKQAKTRPNPTFEFSVDSTKIVRNGEDLIYNAGVSIPLEPFDRRGSRINFALVEVELNEAQIKNQERLLAGNIINAYFNVLSTIKQLKTIEKIIDFNFQATEIVKRKTDAKGDLDLLNSEFDRLNSQSLIVKGELEAAVTELKLLTGTPLENPLLVRETLDNASLPAVPDAYAEAFQKALASRPDVRQSTLEIELAKAGARVAKAEGKPNMSLNFSYLQGRSYVGTDAGDFLQPERGVNLGLSVDLPVFNRNQGAKAEAAILVRQTEMRRSHLQKVVKAEILSNYQKLAAQNLAVETLKTSAVPSFLENVESFRASYEKGEVSAKDLIDEQNKLLEAINALAAAQAERFRALANIVVGIGDIESLK